MGLLEAQRRLIDRGGTWLFGGLLLGMLLVGCATPTFTPPAPGTRQPKSAHPAPQALVVLHTNDNWGEVEPCG